MSWHVTANEIDKWSSAHTRDAQEILPLLIKKLILATVESKYIHFPSGDSILTGGLDGILDIDKGNAFVPEGKTVWELGTNVNINKKAEDDYKKRTDSLADKEVSYIFATTKTWAKKSEFEDEKNKEKKWKEVKGVNSDDLETWLNLAPAVHRWFARLIGKRPLSSLDTEQAFEQWSSQTNINLLAGLVIKTREEQSKRLMYLLSENPSKIIIASSSEQDSYAFILASLKDEVEYSCRVLIITSQEAWDELMESDNSLIFVYQGFTPNNIGMAIRNGHYVIEAQESINMQDKSFEIIELPKIRKGEKVSVLEEMGFNHHDAWEIYEDTKGFLHAIVRHPLLEPLEKSVPDWVISFDIDVLSTILFVNSWNRNNTDDIQILEMLSGLPYEEFEKNLYKLQKEKNTPIRLVGNIWQVISKINLWDLVADKISIAQIDKLKPIIFEIFSEIDPAFELPPKERCLASIYNKEMKYSGLIRESVADTLVLVSTFGGQKINYPSDINIVISYWLKELFELNIDVEAWYSYHSQLSLLAEASPDSFLTALEITLENQSSTKLEELFEDGGDMGGCFHCDLLWALEIISWNIQFLPRVVLVLAGLSQLEIKSNMANQPFNTLKDIFLGWINYSSVTYQEKIQILQNILYKIYPDIAWKLLIELLPDNHNMTSGIVKPKYQDWDEAIDKDVNRKGSYLYYKGINELLLKYVGNDNQRWHDVFSNIDKFYKVNYFKVVDTFIALDKSLFTDEIRLLIATDIREKINSHREYPDANWALPKEWIDRLETAFNFIEPDNLIDKYHYLFDMGNIDILTPLPYDPEDKDFFRKNDKLVENLREEAVVEIIKNKGFSELVSLIKKVPYSGDIGRIIFLTTADEYQDEILEWLNGENNNLLVCARHYIANMSFDESILKKLNDKQRTEVLLSLSFNSIVFELLKKQNKEVQQLFWENNNYYFRIKDEDISYTNWIIEQFSLYKQYIKAVDFISNIINIMKKNHVDIDINLVSKILIKIDPNREKLNTYAISEVIKFLQDCDVEKEIIKMLEWKYLKLNNFKPINWEKEIITDPKAFVQLVSWVYKPKKERDENNGLTQEQIKNKASNAKELLDRVSLFAKYEDIDKMDVEKLKNWILGAKKAFEDVDRVSIGNRLIGQILAKSPNGKDGIFPCEETRVILEEISTKEMDEEFLIGKQNLRGMTMRAHDEGGEQEYKLAEKYKNDANILKFTYPKTSALLRKLSDSYIEYAKREDLSNELN